MLLGTNYGFGLFHRYRRRRVLCVKGGDGNTGFQTVVLRIAVGYPDWNDPVNELRSEREPLDNVYKWYDFFAAEGS